MFRVIICILVLTSICFSQQIVNSKNENLIKGADIIRKAKDASGISSSMNSFLVKLHRVSNLEFQGSDLSNDDEVEITILHPNKIRVLSVFKDGLSRNIWNENRFRQTLESESDGQTHIYDTTNGVPFSKVSKDALDAHKSKKTNIKALDSRVAGFRNSLWRLVFPLLLIHPIESSAEFEYLGRVKAGEKVANVVQTKTASGYIIQFFFDEKTSTLLLMIEKFQKEDREYENKFYYSNREIRNDVLVPTKVKVEHKVTAKGQTPITFFEYIDLLNFEVNPIIKAEIFKIN